MLAHPQTVQQLPNASILTMKIFIEQHTTVYVISCLPSLFTFDISTLILLFLRDHFVLLQQLYSGVEN
uniref:Uncharacterized protein n=1 Tax=Strigamia maritima TaxID=126957 RepID=T1JF82_STRMM